MSDLTITPTRLSPSGHRARVLSEAVVSAYLRDISPPRRSTPTAVAAIDPVAPVAAVAAVAPVDAVDAAALDGARGTAAPSIRPGRHPRRSLTRTRASQRRAPLAIGAAAAVQALRRP